MDTFGGEFFAEIKRQGNTYGANKQKRILRYKG